MVYNVYTIYKNGEIGDGLLLLYQHYIHSMNMEILVL